MSIEIKDVCLTIDDTPILHNISLTLSGGMVGVPERRRQDDPAARDLRLFEAPAGHCQAGWRGRRRAGRESA